MRVGIHSDLASDEFSELEDTVGTLGNVNW